MPSKPKHAPTTNLNIRGFSPALLRQIKATAALQGKTMRAWVIEAIHEKMRSENGKMAIRVGKERR